MTQAVSPILREERRSRGRIGLGIGEYPAVETTHEPKFPEHSALGRDIRQYGVSERRANSTIEFSDTGASPPGICRNRADNGTLNRTESLLGNFDSGRSTGQHHRISGEHRLRKRSSREYPASATFPTAPCYPEISASERGRSLPAYLLQTRTHSNIPTETYYCG